MHRLYPNLKFGNYQITKHKKPWPLPRAPYLPFDSSAIFVSSLSLSLASVHSEPDLFTLLRHKITNQNPCLDKKTRKQEKEKEKEKTSPLSLCAHSIFLAETQLYSLSFFGRIISLFPNSWNSQMGSLKAVSKRYHFTKNPAHFSLFL